MAIAFADIKEGDAIPSIKKDPITQVQLIRYAGAAGDFNPIHTVPSYAKEAGLPGTIAHGMLIMGILGQSISAWAGVGPVAKFNVSFKGMTLPGDVLSTYGEVIKKTEKDDGNYVEAKVSVKDEKGDVKVEGKVSLKF
jgi:acyl dehydratase